MGSVADAEDMLKPAVCNISAVVKIIIVRY